MREARFLTFRTLALALGLMGCMTAAALPAFAQQGAPPALLLFRADNEAAMRAAVSDVTKAGGVLRHSFPPHVAIFSLPERAEAALAADPRITLIARGAVDPASLPEQYGRTAHDAVVAWNEQYATPRAPSPPAAGAPLVGEARPSPRAKLASRAGLAPAPPGADQWQTTEYLMGTTTISLILLESNGAIDPNTEDWAPAETSQVASNCVGGMNWWGSIYPYSAAPLSFTWEYHYAVPTGYEPINHPSESPSPNDGDKIWIADALTYLGYPCTTSTYWDALYEYLNDLRDAHATDWAFAVFVTDSSNDADGYFSDGYFAYAYINGPAVVMTYDNDGWGIGNMDSVLAHEAGHIYGAADEYCDPGYACCDATEYYGYLRIRNTNCDTNPICLMNDNSWAVCTVSRQQLGWRDSDADGRPDILDVPPPATLNSYSPDPSTDTTPTFTGSASVGYFPNHNPWYAGPDVTLNRIANVQYRVSGGPWQDCVATDGAFDEPTESYTFTTAQLDDDTYTFEVRAVDTSGNTSSEPYPSDTLTITGHTITIAIGADPLTIPSGGTVALSASAVDEKGHSIVSYSWDDGGAGGVFLPTATTTGPAYAAPDNTSGGDLTVTLTLSATCDDTPPKTDDSSVAITLKFDYDGDGMPDYWEQQHGFDQTSSADAGLDADGDGLTNLEEYQHGTDPGSGDTDADGMPDNWELGNELDPTNNGDASGDTDHDGLSALQEYQHGADPGDRDTDDDGFGDAEEVTLDSDPANAADKPDHGHFSDVDPTGYGVGGTDPFWAFHEIEACFRSGIVTGYTDGSYQPAVWVSRDQMAVYVARALAGGDANVPRDYLTPSFTDVAADYWAFHHIEYAVERGIVRGYEDGSYQPLMVVDRGTMAVYVARGYAEFTGDDLDGFPRPIIPTFADVPTQEWSYKEVEYCFDQGVVNGYEDGLYHPEIVVTRDQMAVYVQRAFELAF